jgi:hypothetical protein
MKFGRGGPKLHTEQLFVSLRYSFALSVPYATTWGLPIRIHKPFKPLVGLVDFKSKTASVNGKAHTWTPNLL